MKTRRTTRQCGSCAACCTALGIDGLPTGAKPPGEPCPHESGERSKSSAGCGCSIYDRRPRGCRVYECLWLRGEIHDNPKRDFRPDRLGVLFDHEADGAVAARELRPGAADDVAVQYLLRQLSADGPVALLRADGRQELFGAGNRRVRLEVVSCR